MRILLFDLISKYLAFSLINMLPSEQELSVEIAHINCVQIDLELH
jgi:hypothetical protein